MTESENRFLLIPGQIFLYMVWVRGRFLRLENVFRDGMSIKQMKDIPGTMYRTQEKPEIESAIKLPTFREICDSKKSFAKSFRIQHMNTDPFNASPLVEEYPGRVGCSEYSCKASFNRGAGLGS